MAESFNYSGNICQKYVFKKYDTELSTVKYQDFDFYKDINCPVTAYAFSNVDAYGAQVLCWHNEISENLTAAIKVSADALLSADEKFGPAWNQISAQAIADVDKIKAKGWMSVNTRYISK